MTNTWTWIVFATAIAWGKTLETLRIEHGVAITKVGIAYPETSPYRIVLIHEWRTLDQPIDFLNSAALAASTRFGVNSTDSVVVDMIGRVREKLKNIKGNWSADESGLNAASKPVFATAAEDDVEVLEKEMINLSTQNKVAVALSSKQFALVNLTKIAVASNSQAVAKMTLDIRTLGENIEKGKRVVAKSILQRAESVWTQLEVFTEDVRETVEEAEEMVENLKAGILDEKLLPQSKINRVLNEVRKVLPKECQFMVTEDSSPIKLRRVISTEKGLFLITEVQIRNETEVFNIYNLIPIVEKLKNGTYLQISIDNNYIAYNERTEEYALGNTIKVDLDPTFKKNSEKNPCEFQLFAGENITKCKIVLRKEFRPTIKKLDGGEIFYSVIDESFVKRCAGKPDEEIVLSGIGVLNARGCLIEWNGMTIRNTGRVASNATRTITRSKTIAESLQENLQIAGTLESSLDSLHDRLQEKAETEETEEVSLDLTDMRALVDSTVSRGKEWLKEHQTHINSAIGGGVVVTAIGVILYKFTPLKKVLMLLIKKFPSLKKFRRREVKTEGKGAKYTVNEEKGGGGGKEVGKEKTTDEKVVIESWEHSPLMRGKFKQSGKRNDEEIELIGDKEIDEKESGKKEATCDILKEPRGESFLRRGKTRYPRGRRGDVIYKEDIKEENGLKEEKEHEENSSGRAPRGLDTQRDSFLKREKARRSVEIIINF